MRILTETADALARAHAAGVVHRDIKPENILGLCELDTVTWGDLLTTHGRAAEADSLLQREAVTPLWNFGTLLRTLALARAADRAGDSKTAIDAYVRIEDEWAHADPELQPTVQEARAALARLSSDKR